MAWEIFEKLNKQGLRCDLLTGQEWEEIESANLLSCTVEMTPIDAPVEVAVIDEIQMIGMTMGLTEYCF